LKRSININPLKKTATWEQIKAKREELKRSPITTSKGAFDVDDVSFQNISTAIGSFDALSDAAGGALGWKLADNSLVEVSLIDLEAVRNAVAVRANTIHTHAEMIAANPPTVGELGDLSLWGLAF
jgi:hypothetical protein